MKATTSMRIRASCFLSDRYPYRERLEYLIDLVPFRNIVIPAIVSVGWRVDDDTDVAQETIALSDVTIMLLVAS
jgi:hypothetical protein